MATEIQKLDLFIPIKACEPNCYSTLKADLPDLLARGKSWSLDQNISLEDFVAKHLKSGKIEISPKENEAIVHAQCHHKSVNGLAGLHTILYTLYGKNFTALDSGCCGMTGSFASEKEQAVMSRKMAEQKLIPIINTANDTVDIILNGFTYSHQLDDLTNRKAIQWIELLSA